MVATGADADTPIWRSGKAYFVHVVDKTPQV